MVVLQKFDIFKNPFVSVFKILSQKCLRFFIFGFHVHKLYYYTVFYVTSRPRQTEWTSKFGFRSQEMSTFNKVQQLTAQSQAILVSHFLLMDLIWHWYFDLMCQLKKLKPICHPGTFDLPDWSVGLFCSPGNEFVTRCSSNIVVELKSSNSVTNQQTVVAPVMAHHCCACDRTSCVSSSSW